MTTQDSSPVTVGQNAASEGDVVYSALWLPDADRGAAFYGAVLGWPVPGTEPVVGMAGGVADPTLFLCHAVDDIDAAVANVRAAGGQAGEPRMERYGQLSDCTDNQGMRFALLRGPRGQRRPVPRPGHGGLLYLTVGVPDSGAYRDFYGAVFGWRFTPGRVADGWGVTGVSPMTGMHGGADRPTVAPMFAVRDITAAVAAVRASGGTSTDPERQPYGTTADCTDDQGLKFHLGLAE
jgi:predicted enzyme related to lactoylglutathione lyase